MSIVLAIFYGIIQGVTEFLPVSSSGHLNIAQNLFGMENPEAFGMTFDILLHLATLIAVFIVYWRDIFPLIPAFFRMVGKLFRGNFKPDAYTADERMCMMVIIATLPLAAAIFLQDRVEFIASNTKIIGAILLFNAVVLFISDKLARGNDTAATAKPRSALAVGLCQLCAIVPGLSRSGSTITGGLLCGFSREFAVKFSFILSIPAILGANIMQVPDMIASPIAAADIPAYLLGMLAAALSGVLAMRLLILISKKSNFRFFSYYCVAVGLIAIIFG